MTDIDGVKLQPKSKPENQRRTTSESDTSWIPPIAKIDAGIRSQYLADSLSNLAAASINTAKRKNLDTLYRAGTNGISTYAQAMEGLFLSEHDNICSIFPREDWGPLFQAVCQPALVELGRTLRELSAHVESHIKTDCYLAYETVEIISALSNNLEGRTGELKASLAASLKPIRETAKSSLSKLMDNLRTSALAIPQLPPDGAPVPLVGEAMQRLQTMVEFLRPLSSIMVSLGDGGWKSAAASRGGVGDAIPSLASFDIGADGQEIFAHYCFDTLEVLLNSLDARAKQPPPPKRPVIAVFLANSVSIIERSIRDSELGPLLEPELEARLGPWKKQTMSLFSETCKDLSVHLFDVIHTGRGARPTSGHGAVDSASVTKSLSSKEREAIKAKFTAFNQGFEEMVARHKQYSMERDVRQRFAKDMQHMIAPLYKRFWDRYHDIDKGKGKYVKFDKASISGVFLSLY